MTFSFHYRALNTFCHIPTLDAQRIYKCVVFVLKHAVKIITNASICRLQTFRSSSASLQQISNLAKISHLLA